MSNQQVMDGADRAAVYSKDGGMRVISLPNGLWVAQRFAGGKGLNRCTVDGRPQEHYDPWESRSAPTEDKLLALQQLAGGR